jgi:hypothetical protein
MAVVIESNVMLILRMSPPLLSRTEGGAGRGRHRLALV